MKNKSIYVGNLSYKATEQELTDLFAQFGSVSSVNIVCDRQTGRPRGYAFVEMEDSNASLAIQSLHETMFLGRTLRVNEARSASSQHNS